VTEERALGHKEARRREINGKLNEVSSGDGNGNI
jgi:hypothetical protein